MTTRSSILVVLLVAQTVVFKTCSPCPSVFVRQGTVVNVSQISTPPLQLPWANATCGPTGWQAVIPPLAPTQPPILPPGAAPLLPPIEPPSTTPAVPPVTPSTTPQQP